MSIGDNIKVLRIKKDISKQEMADFLGVDRKTYMRWEEGKSGVDSEYLPKIAEFLQVEITDLFPKKPGEIVINQNNHHKDNKDNSINGVILLITDKEVVDNIVDVVKKKFEKQ